MAIGIIGNLASPSRFVQDLFGHEHVAHRDTSIEINQKGEFGGLRQLVAL